MRNQLSIRTRSRYHLLMIIAACGLLFFLACGSGPEPTPAADAAPDIPVADSVVLVLAELPPQVPQSGELAAARTWTDADGPHLLTVFVKTTEATGETDPQTEEIGPGTTTMLLLAQQYRLRNDSIAATEWMWESLVDACPLDATLRLDTLYLTDLDSDEHQEVTLVVSRSCKGDVSPDELQIVLHEDGERMLLEGLHWLPQPELRFDTTLGDNLTALAADAAPAGGAPPEYGRYRRADGFAGQPAIFREFAVQLWRAHRE
jgi:hypothetical protein